jgi:hypothetical protein
MAPNRVTLSITLAFAFTAAVALAITLGFVPAGPTTPGYAVGTALLIALIAVAFTSYQHARPTGSVGQLLHEADAARTSSQPAVVAATTGRSR